LAAVQDEEASRAPELVGKHRHHRHGQHLAQQVRPGQLQTLDAIGLVEINRG
jgi:hypothetical protein